MMQWTNQQRMAIETRGKNLLVSAAAGSGKTAVLVQRIIDMITKEGVDVTSLLVVTFTNAAASEMKERIKNRLLDYIDTHPEDEIYIRKQLQNVPRANISTMHSFCMEILRRNFHIIDIDPSFRIASQTLVQILKSEAMSELMETKYEEEDEDFLSLVDSYGGKRGDQNIEALINMTYSFIQSQPYPLKWLKEKSEEFNIDENKFNESLWAKAIKEDITIKLEGARLAALEGIRLCNFEGGPKPYEEALRSDIDLIEDIEAALNESLEIYYSKISYVSFQRMKTISKKMKEDLDENLIIKVKDLRDSLIKKNGIEKLKKSASIRDFKRQIKELKDMYPLMKSLKETVGDFDRIYKEKKSHEGVLDFSDLEHYALNLLEDSRVRDDLREKYKYIFFDEYQDSNIVQETIINHIKREDNLFLVGDVKQSIYRFRLADPTLFIEKYERFSKGEETVDMRLDLSENFRSRMEILEFANFIFRSLMSKELGEIDYDESAHLRPSMEFPKESSRVQMTVIESKSEEEAKEEDEDIESPELEAMYTAQKIKELIGKEHYNPKTKKYETIGYGDIVILMRSPSKAADAFGKIFKSQNIPCYVDYNSSYYDVMEIRLFLDLLKIIDNIEQDEAILSVMNSVIGGFEIEELIKIRIKTREGSFYKAVITYRDEENDEIANKINSFINKINRYSFVEKLKKLDEFLWYLMIDTNYYSYMGAMAGGKERQENLKSLLDKAKEFEDSASKGLFGFLRFIDKLLKDKGDTQEAKAISQSENLVRVMSIHKSKGLEFPVVFVCGLGKNFNQQDFKNDITFHKDLGLGPKYVNLELGTYNDSIAKTAIKIKLTNEMLSEELRILYVALTRPVDYLFMVGSVRSIEKAADEALKGDGKGYLFSKKNFLSWMLAAVARHKDGLPLRQASEKAIDDEEIKESNSPFVLNLVRKSDILEIKEKEETNKESLKALLKDYNYMPNEEILNEVKRRLEYVYPFETDIKVPPKTSVSQIVRDEALNLYAPLIIEKAPRFLEGKKAFTGAQKGTVMHFVMQNLDIHKIKGKNDIINQINIFTVNELLTEEEAKAVDIDKILEFFESDIGKRLIESDLVKREVSFMLKKEKVIVSGIIDCCFEEKGRWVIIDYKTDYIGLSSPEEAASKYSRQLELYKEALLKSSGMDVAEGYIYLFDRGKGIRII